ncbi:MAG: hypothetical protein IJ711_03835 [Lachnospiraceae bacterium]|nr:hypothetical protein [Lachnospiraceae bacterium]
MNRDTKGKKKEQIEREAYCDAVEFVTAPEGLVNRVKAIRPAAKRKSYALRKLAYIAAAITFLFVSGNAVSYAATGSTLVQNMTRMTIFYDTKEEADAAKKADGCRTYGVSEILTGELRDGERMTDEEWNEVIFDVWDEDIFISDETGSANDAWTRKLVRTRIFDGFRHVTTTSYSGRDVADLVAFHPFLTAWDISWLGENYTPDPKIQFLKIYTEEDTGKLIQSIIEARYGNAEEGGAYFWLAASCDPAFDYGKDYVNGSALDFYEYYTTKDGVEIAVMQKGDEIIANLNAEKQGCCIRAYHMTTGQVEEIADHLNLAQFVKVYSTMDLADD